MHSAKARRVLVLDGFWNKSLAAVRSLGRRGCFVAVGERTRLAPAAFSRFCRRRFVHPSVVGHPEAFLAALEREVSMGGYDVLLPMELSTQVLVTKNRERLEKKVRIPFADAELALRVHDKGFLACFAREHGIHSPATFLPAGPEEAAAMAPELPYPVLVKPRHSSGGRGILRVDREADFPARYARVHARDPRPIVQECIPPGGEALGVAVLMNFASEPRASFAYRRLREYPIAGGPSTLRESVWNPDLRETAERLLSLLGWVGVAMVEFKVDPRDGRPKLLEVNPRFWGSLHHAIVCGVDFPFLLYSLAVEGDVARVHGYRVGAKSRSLLHGELLHFLANPDRFHLKPALHDFSISDDVLSASDPFPTLGRILSLVALVGDRELRGMARG
ncbi:MAG TPA: ATP-grasp domain-containing protein [Candidatus Methylomirabilis sp.]|nr:ATP-grasp domain-containing protein [Candidatus Methylomirabilis sp.]